MSTYRRTTLTAPRSIQFYEDTRPAPGPGEALVALTAVGICGSDVHWYTEGRIGETLLKSPLTLGHEPAGKVVEIGPGVDRGLVGKRVAIEPAIHCGHCKFCLEGNYNICPDVKFLGTPPTQGAFRELIAHPASLLVELPDSISDDIGALLEPLAIGVHAVDLLKVRLGSTIVIQGAGPVGLCTLLAARLTAPTKLIVVEPLPYRRELARKMGADLVLDPADPNLIAEVKKATGGYGAKYVFEAVGTMETFGLMVELAEPGAKVGCIGIEPGDHFGYNNSVARRKGLTIFMIRRSRRTLEKAIEITHGGYWRPEPLITHHVGLGALAQSMELVAEYGDGVMKAMVDPRK